MKPIIEETSNKGAVIYQVTSDDAYVFNKSNCVLFETAQNNGSLIRTYIEFPFKSDALSYVYDESPFFDRAKVLWETVALDRIHPTASVITQNGKIISEAGNGKFLETIDMCERKRLNIPTGTRYDLCDGNHDFPNHSERKASEKIIREQLNLQHKPLTAYLYGHWWCCKPCSEAMIHAGVTKVVISKRWTKSFLGIV